MGRLFKRGRVWHAWVKDRGGEWKRRSTNCTDKRAAETVAGELERLAADPAHAAARATTTQRILDDYLASRKRIGRSEGTLHHVRVKAGALLALLPSRAEDITHPACERYIDARLADGVRRTTIKKELRVLKAALAYARKNGLWLGLPDDVIPQLKDDYRPGRRALTPLELVALVQRLPASRAAHAVYIVATGARWGESLRAQGNDWDPETDLVLLRGTKTEAAERFVPVRGVGRSLLRWALGQHVLPFFPWGNVRRDLEVACRAARIAPVTPNDLRRTFGTWLRNGGVEPSLIASAMGHTTSAMVERVYGRLTPEALGKLLEERTKTSEAFASELGLSTTEPARTVATSRPAEAPIEPAPPSGGVLLMRCGQADSGRLETIQRRPGTSDALELAENYGAQGRNRTADTGIFSPLVEPENPRADLGSLASDGDSDVRYACGSGAVISDPLGMARAAVLRGPMPPREGVLALRVLAVALRVLGAIHGPVPERRAVAP